jgi:hypothetical protein
MHKAPSVESPDRFALTEGVEQVWNEEKAPATEATEEQDERLERLAIRLGEFEGVNEPEVQFIIRVEQLVPKYRILYGRWLVQDPDARGQVSLAQFAENKLTELQAEKFPDLDDLKIHVFALGRLAGRTTGACRSLARQLWDTSRLPSPFVEDVERQDARETDERNRAAYMTPETRNQRAGNAYLNSSPSPESYGPFRG